jgi:hypothetical protein
MRRCSLSRIRAINRLARDKSGAYSIWDDVAGTQTFSDLLLKQHKHAFNILWDDMPCIIIICKRVL